MIPVDVQGVAFLPPETAPVMLLRESVGERRWLAIVIGAPEADTLLSAKERVEHARPTTIELIDHVIGALGRRVVRVEVTGLEDGIFHADLVLDADTRVSARPSDAVAIGVRAGVPVEVAEDVLDEAAVQIEVADPGTTEDVADAGQGDRERTIADFRALLDDISPEDFRDTD